jgi:Big-like domain-containing protein
MKRTLSLVLALVMVLGSFGAVFAVDTEDKVEVGAFLETVGVLQGDEEGNLMLDNTLLRRDMVILLSRLMGVEEVAKDFPAESLTFEDITDAHYNGYIAWSVENALIKGHSEDLFGFNENVTAQQYVTVLMRALDYDVEDEAYATVLADAKELGLCGDLEVENDDQITRGQMAVMTFNALGTTMNDSEVTLAESLGVEMPEPEVTEATEVENVYADNLKEIVVVFDGQVEKDSAELVGNYSLDKGEVDKAVLNEDKTMVVLTVDDSMKNQKERELTVRNIKTEDGALKTQTIKFTPVDRAIPEVKMVEGLGDKAVKITFTEPVKGSTVKASNFKIDGSSFVGNIDKDDTNVVILKLYRKLSEGTHTVEIKGIEDFAGYLMVTTERDFEAKEDNEAPAVKSVDATLEYVTVTFTEPVQDSSVRGGSKAYWKATESTSVKNNSKVNPERISADTYKFDFTDKALPGYSVYLYLEGVKDYSDNVIDKDAPVLVNAVIDQTRPEVLNVKVNDDNDEIEVKFSKDISTKSAEDRDNYELEDEDDKKVRFQKPTVDGKTITIKLYKALEKGEYTLNLEGLEDKTVLKNTILPYSTTIEVGSVDGPSVTPVNEFSLNGREALIKFNRAMTISGEYGVSNPDNYSIEYQVVTKKADGSIDTSESVGSMKYSSLPSDAEIQVFADGKSVIITMPEEIDDEDFESKINLEAINVRKVEDEDGKTLKHFSQRLEQKTIEFEITKATLKDSKTIEVEVNRVIVSENKNMTLNNADVSIDSQEVNDDKVTLKLSDHLYATEGIEVVAAINTFDLLGGGTQKADTSTIKDEVDPKLTEDNDDYGFKVSSTTDNQFTIEFTEEITSANKDVYKTQLEIERLEQSQKAKDLGQGDFNVEVDGNKLIITIKEEAFYYYNSNDVLKKDLAEAYFAVTLKDNSLIKDLAGNSAEGFADVETRAVVKNPNPIS